MHPLAHGVDLVEVSRIAVMCADHPERFVERCFTPAEQAYCLGRKREAEHLAARFAAKEAVLKALGTGLSSGLFWTDIEVHRDTDGRPSIQLHNKAAQAATALGIRSWLVSLSHTQTNAIASVIGVGSDPDPT